LTPAPVMMMRLRKQVEMTPTMNHLHLHAGSVFRHIDVGITHLQLESNKEDTEETFRVQGFSAYSKGLGVERPPTTDQLRLRSWLRV